MLLCVALFTVKTRVVTSVNEQEIVCGFLLMATQNKIMHLDNTNLQSRPSLLPAA